MYGRRILILVPHPDDEVVGCCAAIGRAHAQGAEIFGLYLTTGVPDAAVLWPWERQGHAAWVARRRAEALRVAELLGLRPVTFLDIPTRQLKDNLAAALAETRGAIATHRIDCVWTPAYEGGHQDHDTASFLATQLETEVWEFAEYNYADGKMAMQRFPEPNGTEQVLSLSAEEVALKRRALEMYPSEKGNLTYVGTARECFRPQAAYDYTLPPHRGKTFYQRFQWVPFRHPRIDFTTPEEVCRVLGRHE